MKSHQVLPYSADWSIIIHYSFPPPDCAMFTWLAYFSLHPMPHMRTCSQGYYHRAWAQTTMLNLGASLQRIKCLQEPQKSYMIKRPTVGMDILIKSPSVADTAQPLPPPPPHPTPSLSCGIYIARCISKA